LQIIKLFSIKEIDGSKLNQTIKRAITNLEQVLQKEIIWEKDNDVYLFRKD